MRALILAMALGLGACASNSVAPAVPVNREVTLAPGQTVTVASGVSVAFVGVTGDSRCPADAMCVQGGDAIVRLQLTISGDRHDVELHTGDMRPVTARDVTLELVQLVPYPFSSRTIEPGEYRATIRVIR